MNDKFKSSHAWDIFGKNDFERTEVAKNLGRYKFKNNFVRPSK